jgi:SNF2 family DNA or RNA helicase
MTLKGDDNEKLQIKFNDNPKLDALQDIIEGMPPDKKIVIFHHYVYTNQLISDRLKFMGVKHARIYGKSKDPIAELRRFKSEPGTRALVINSKSGSSSLNLQGANYLCFFEQPDSPIDRQQAERRVWRPGQKWRVFIYDLLMKGTADERLRASNKAGENLLKDLLNRKKDL